MDNKLGFIIIGGVCILVLLIGGLRKRSEILINFILRAVLGTIGIYFINQFLISQELFVDVSINPVTVLTSGILGFPGLILLYGINLFKFL